jgi:ubiquinone/menaquinone biosynthesis C-methylase UbiE
VVALDIEPKMLARVRRRAQAQGVSNIHLLVASAHDLPFAAGHFDRATMIAVMGEIRRVLKPAGRLACSELFFDPDYPRATTLARWAEAAGWRQEQRLGHWFYYTLILTPERPKETRP